MHNNISSFRQYFARPRMMLVSITVMRSPFPIIIEVAIMPGQYSTKEVEWQVQTANTVVSCNDHVSVILAHVIISNCYCHNGRHETVLQCKYELFV